MPVGLPPHSHCLGCDDPIPEGEEFCSAECRKNLMDKRKRDSRRMAIFYIGAAIAFAIIGYVATM